MYYMFIFLPLLFLAASAALVVYFYNSSSLRIKKVVSESVDGKKLFVLRLNSSDFLFEESNGEISFLSPIKDNKSTSYVVNKKLEDRALKLLELEHMGQS